MKRNSMVQALSQAAGHSFSRQPAQESETKGDADGQTNRLLRTIPPSRVGKKPITGFFEPEVSRQIKKAAIESDKTMQELLQEAINDLFRKYDLPPIA